ncbi:MAG: hypothetical protein HRT69_12050 [Flavobacteriaceae bacterium]|nr:hypothetical protein [Flavobacteriaceae bacterium]
MLTAINIILLGTLIAVVFQDLKYRAIHVILPIILVVVAIARFLVLDHPVYELFFTVLFLALVLLGLFVYTSIKSKRIINPVDSSIGLGDIVFFIAVVPLFFSTTYILFFSTGMLFSIICHMLFTKNKEAHVPLAGYLSIYLILLFIVDFCIDKELFYTHNII